MTSDDSGSVATHYDRMAGQYDRAIGVFERLFLGDGRSWICTRAAGDVLEIAVGTGRNLPYYDRGVRLVGIDISAGMLAIARERLASVGREADLRLGDAQSLDLPSASFDTVVSTLSMCSIPDERAAIAEAARVLRPGGQFLLLEHVGSPQRAVRAIQRVLDPVAVRCMCDHLLREPVDGLRAVGLEVERVERSKLGIIERVIARKPGALAA